MLEHVLRAIGCLQDGVQGLVLPVFEQSFPAQDSYHSYRSLSEQGPVVGSVERSRIQNPKAKPARPKLRLACIPARMRQRTAWFVIWCNLSETDQDPTRRDDRRLELI